MKVSELKELLEDCPDDMEVMFAYPSGDHWHNVLASEIDDVDQAHVRHSDYHRTDKVLDTFADNYEAKETDRTVVLLK